MWKGAFDSCPDDQLGFGVTYAHVGSRAQAFDQARGAPMRGSETVLEVNELAQITGWLQLQPSFQYVIAPGPRLQDTAVLGLRAIVTF